MNIQELLNFSAQQGSSDLHITAGMPPLIRVDGDIRVSMWIQWITRKSMGLFMKL